MLHRTRSLVAALATACLVAGLATPSFAASRLSEIDGDEASVPMVFDVLVMRPIGLATTIMGATLYAFPVAPIMAMTRPRDIMKPFTPLVVAPARFTFVDPIGRHP